MVFAYLGWDRLTVANGIIFRAERQTALAFLAATYVEGTHPSAAADIGVAFDGATVQVKFTIELLCAEVAFTFCASFGGAVASTIPNDTDLIGFTADLCDRVTAGDTGTVGRTIEWRAAGLCGLTISVCIATRAGVGCVVCTATSIARLRPWCNTELVDAGVVSGAICRCCTGVATFGQIYIVHTRNENTCRTYRKTQ